MAMRAAVMGVGTIYQLPASDSRLVRCRVH